MAALVFIVDFEEGHLFPTFGLAKSLQERGHIVHYIGIADIKRSVTEQGFEFHPVLEKQYPLGFREKFKKRHFNKGNYSKITFVDCIENELPVILDTIKPEGIVMSTYLSMEALFMHYRYAIKPVIFMPEINSNPLDEFRYEFGTLGTKQYDIFQNYKSYNITLKNNKVSIFRKLFGNREKVINDAEFQEFLSPLVRFEQIVACPEQFELPGRARSNVHYIGPCVRNKAPVSTALIRELTAKNKKIIYVSMGSQTERIQQVCEALYVKIIEAMKDAEMKDYHVVLSSSLAVDLGDMIETPENVTIVPWIDALEVLEISAAIITHGGLGLIKESIFYGVPMIVLPDKYDQPMNAERVVYHQLGVKDDLINVTKEALKAHILNVTTDQNIREKLQQMKNVFRRRDESQEGAILIEKIFRLD